MKSTIAWVALFSVAMLQEAAARVFANDAAARVETAARQALAAMSEGDVLRTQLAAARRRLAEATVDRKGYSFAV